MPTLLVPKPSSTHLLLLLPILPLISSLPNELLEIGYEHRVFL
jgi:hypothetical protein